jgi:hypothetical protein
MPAPAFNPAIPARHAIIVCRWWQSMGSDYQPERTPDGYTVTDTRTGEEFGPFTDARGIEHARRKAMACRRKLVAKG